MTRVTVAIDEKLLQQLKKKAASEGRTMFAVANDLLRLGLKEPPSLPAQVADLEGR